MKINLRESLNRLDLQTDNKYDLRNTYDCSKISDDKKKKLAEALNKNASAKTISRILDESYGGYDYYLIEFFVDGRRYEEEYTDTSAKEALERFKEDYSDDDYKIREIYKLTGEGYIGLGYPFIYKNESLSEDFSEVEIKAANDWNNRKRRKYGYKYYPEKYYGNFDIYINGYELYYPEDIDYSDSLADTVAYLKSKIKSGEIESAIITDADIYYPHTDEHVELWRSDNRFGEENYGYNPDIIRFYKNAKYTEALDEKELYKVVIKNGPTELDFESNLSYEDAQEIIDYYNGRWIDEKGYEWSMEIEEDELEESLNESNDFSNKFLDIETNLRSDYYIRMKSGKEKVDTVYLQYDPGIDNYPHLVGYAHDDEGHYDWAYLDSSYIENLDVDPYMDSDGNIIDVNRMIEENPDYFYIKFNEGPISFDESTKRSSKSLNETDYGGAYDIEDDMFFTKEDIVEFAEEICEYLGDIFGYQYDINNVYMDGPKKLYINIYDNNYIEVESTFDIDMRKIKKPSDLSKVYGLTIENWFQKAFAREYRDAGLYESLTEAKKVGSNELTNKRGLPKDSWELVKITDGVVSYKGTNECDIYSRELDNNYNLYDYYQGEVIFDDYGIDNPQLIQDVFPDVGTKVKLAIYKVPEDDPDHHWTGDYFVDYIDETNESLTEQINLPGYAVKYVTGYAGNGVNNSETEWFRTEEERDRRAKELEDKDYTEIKTWKMDNFYHTLPKDESLKEAYKPLAIGYMILKKEIPNHINYAEFANYDEVVTAIPSEADVVVYPRDGKIGGTDIAYWQFDAIDPEGKKTKANFSTYIYSLKDFLNNDEMELKLIPDFKLIDEYPYLIKVDDGIEESLTEGIEDLDSISSIKAKDMSDADFKVLKPLVDEYLKDRKALGNWPDSVDERNFVKKWYKLADKCKEIAKNGLQGITGYGRLNDFIKLKVVDLARSVDNTFPWYTRNNLAKFNELESLEEDSNKEPFLKNSKESDYKFTVELYTEKNKDPNRIRFNSYKEAFSFAKNKSNSGIYEVIMITKPGINGISVVNSFDINDGWFKESLKEALDDKIDLDYETDFDDGEVEEGNTFIEDGRKWSWIERIAGPIHLDFDNWAVWSARDWDYIQEQIRPILLNKEELTTEKLTKIYDEAEVAYFVVDEDTGFIDWGPVETSTEAQDFLNGKVEDYENDEEYEEVEIEEESLTESKAIKNDGDYEVTLHYDDIGNGKEYDYKLGYDEVVDYLREIAWSNGDGPEDANEDEYLEWVMDNFDELADKYELNILDYFEDEASQYEYDHRYDEP